MHSGTFARHRFFIKFFKKKLARNLNWQNLDTLGVDADRLAKPRHITVCEYSQRFMLATDLLQTGSGIQSRPLLFSEEKR